MEVVYRALTGTKLEKIFTSEEECKRYEYLNSIKMWDWAGIELMICRGYGSSSSFTRRAASS